MITANFFSPKLFRSLYSKVIYCTVFLVLLSLAPCAYADLFECSLPQDDPVDPNHPNNPISYKNCVFGRCGICDATKGYSGWLNPMAEVIYQPLVYGNGNSDPLHIMPVERKYIGMGKCKWLAFVRFCVRPTKSGQKDGPWDPSNQTGRPQICAYEDPCDGMDPPDGNCVMHSNQGPFHYYTPNADAMSVSRGALYGAFGGGLGAAAGALAAAIMQNFNQVVITAIGCIDRKIGPMPPAWKNNAWWNNSTPMPTFRNNASSVFENPQVYMYVCTFTDNSSGSSTPTTSIIPCQCADASADPDTCIIFNSPSSIVTTLSGYNASYTSNGTTYYSTVTKQEPDTIVITSGAAYGDAGAMLIKKLPRPGYIPLPVVTAAVGGAAVTNGDVPSAITVTLRGASMTLEEPVYYKVADPTQTYVNPDQTSYPHNCGLALSTSTYPASGYLQQVPFSIQRPCLQWSSTWVTTDEAASCPTGAVTPTTSLTPHSETVCTQYDPTKVCLLGYLTAPYVAVIPNPASPTSPTSPSSTTDGSGGIAITSTPLTNPNVENSNVYVTPTPALGNHFPNIHSNQENGYYLSEGYTTNVFIYPYTVTTPSGTVSSANPQTATLNANGNNVRPLTPFEAGLCVYTQANKAPTIYSNPGDYTYSVHINCSQIKVQVWGSGGSGHYNVGTCGGITDVGGGAGGYVEATFNVTPSTGSALTQYNLHVGAGGGLGITNTNGGYNGNTSWFSSSSTLYAYGGSGTGVGGSGGGTGGIVHNGANGQSSCSTIKAGAKAYLGTSQPASDCPNGGSQKGTYQAPMGGGGCVGDDGGSQNGSWGVGGNGQVIVQCTLGL